jgi:hypothetical protein
MNYALDPSINQFRRTGYWEGTKIQASESGTMPVWIGWQLPAIWVNERSADGLMPWIPALLRRPDVRVHALHEVPAKGCCR